MNVRQQNSGIQDDDAQAENAQQPESALKADYKGATPCEAAAALLTRSREPRRSVQQKKTERAPACLVKPDSQSLSQTTAGL